MRESCEREIRVVGGRVSLKDEGGLLGGRLLDLFKKRIGVGLMLGRESRVGEKWN